MIRSATLALSVVCLAAPVLSQELEFMPGTPVSHKIDYAKKKWQDTCKAPVPNIDPSSIPGGEDYINRLTKQKINILIREYCGQPQDVIAAHIN